MVDELNQIQALAGEADSISNLSWSSDGQLLAAVCDARIKVWLVEAGRLLAVSDEVWTGLSNLKWSPTGPVLASCRATYALRLWDVTQQTGFQLQGEISSIESLAWSPDGKLLAVAGSRDKRVQIWNVESRKIVETIELPSVIHDLTWFPTTDAIVALTSHAVHIRKSSGETLRQTLPPDFDARSVVWSPNGTVLAAGVSNGVRLWHMETEREIGLLETRHERVTSLAFSHDEAFLAFMTADGILELWGCNGWKKIDSLELDQKRISSKRTVAFSPAGLSIALLGAGRSIYVWRPNLQELVRRAEQISTALYTTIKIALVGRSAVGKTVLGWRLVHSVFKEHPSSHGQHFWLFDSLEYTRPDGMQCDVILWDLAGQPDYRMIHVLFLEDVDLALVLFDSSDQDEPLKDVEYWLKQLPRTCRKILVGSKSDRGHSSLSSQELAEFCDHYQIVGGCLVTSALNGENIHTLTERIKNEIDLVDLRPSIATSTFNCIKTFVLGLKETGYYQKGSSRPSVIVSLEELDQQLQESGMSFEYDYEELLAAVTHVERCGFVKVIATSSGKSVLLLIPELLNNLAASFILEARRNERGLGAIDQGAIFRDEFQFPELADLGYSERTILLDATVSLLIARNICFRAVVGKTVLLVFPSLINQKRPSIRSHSIIETTTFIARGPIENVYAELVVLLGYTNTFTRTHQWHNQAEYEIGWRLVCGFRMVEENEGEIQLVLYFANGVKEYERLLFESLVETFLRRPALEVNKYPPLRCDKCEELLPRALVVDFLSKHYDTVFCPKCGNRISITRSYTPSRELAQNLNIATNHESEQTQQRTVFETALVRLNRFRIGQGQNVRTPTCFVSYAWGDPKIEDWVFRLAQDLRNVQIDVLLDRYDNASVGTHIGRYIEKIEIVDFIIVVGTPEYKDKRNQRSTVSIEIDAIQATILDCGSIKQNIIPILRKGEADKSLPLLFRGRVHIDFRDDAAYFAKLFDLILALHDISLSDPTFSDFRLELLERSRKEPTTYQ